MDAYDAAQQQPPREQVQEPPRLEAAGATWTACATWRLGAAGLAQLRSRWAALAMEDVQSSEVDLYHARPLSAAELCCAASHAAAWAEASRHVDGGFALFVEDDVTVLADAVPASTWQCRRGWARAWCSLLREVDWLARRQARMRSGSLRRSLTRAQRTGGVGRALPWA